jgi:hypothetical protein
MPGPKPSRSKKAGRPPEKRAIAPHVRRRQKSASAAYRTGTTMYQSPDVPHVLPG